MNKDIINEGSALVQQAFNNGEVLVYATEAVMGLGCDPDNEAAVKKLLQLKQRSIDKGLILLAANYEQLVPYIDTTAISLDKRPEVFSCWPGPVTLLLPKSNKAPYWITGVHEKIATRVPSYAPLIELCENLGKPIVSTSANLSGEPSCKTLEEANMQFGDKVIYVDGKVEGRTSPSVIKDAVTGDILRGA
jgi:L-threonylcarbamoyladenylate synthase